MAEPIVVSAWPLGIDNTSPRDKLPAGAVRDLVNLDAGSTLTLRAGKRTVYTGTDLRGALGFKSKLLISDDGDLVEYDLLTQASQVLRAVTTGGGVAGCVMNDELFFCTANESLRYDGQTVRRWGVPAVNTQPSVTSVSGFGTSPGATMVAVTVKDAYGVEGGTTAARTVVGGPGLDILVSGLPTPPAGGAVCIYTSAPNGTTLHYYGETTDATFTVTGASRDDQRPLETQFDSEPPQGDMLVEHKGSILIARDSLVWMTQPMRPHAVSRMRGFFPFPAHVNAMVAVTDGVYISADATYFLSNIALESALRRVYDQPIQAGSAAREDDGSAVWLSTEGYMRGSPAGAVAPVTGKRFVPLLTTTGSGARVKYDGRDMLVTTLKGVPRNNPLGAADFFQSEIIRHE